MFATGIKWSAEFKKKYIYIYIEPDPSWKNLAYSGIHIVVVTMSDGHIKLDVS
jgi:hypothetical protein